MSFINEFDIVDRVDGPYLLSLVNLFRSIYGISLLQAVENSDGSSMPESSWRADLVDFPREPLRLSSNSRPVFPAHCHYVGKRVFLFTRLSGDSPELRTAEVLTAEFETLVFCRVSVHRRTCCA